MMIGAVVVLQVGMESVRSVLIVWYCSVLMPAFEDFGMGTHMMQPTDDRSSHSTSA